MFVMAERSCVKVVTKCRICQRKTKRCSSMKDENCCDDCEGLIDRNRDGETIKLILKKN